jgi:hypothetical protein
MSDRVEQPMDDDELCELARTGKQRYAFPIAFGAVDAALWQFLSDLYQIEGTTVQRRGITSGSVLYQLLTKDKKEEIGGLHAQMTHEIVTVVSVVPGPLIHQVEASGKEILTGLLIHALDHFAPWLANAHNQAVEEAEKLIDPEPPSVRTDSGHYAHPSREHRRIIVEQYYADKEQGKAQSRDVWAQRTYGVSGRTLARYIKEAKQDT